MTRALCTIVAVTYNRADLLARSIECINKSKFPLDRLEYILVDDASTDNTSDIIKRFDNRVDVKYVRVRKPVGCVWRDCAVNVNHGIRIASGSNILITHPEVMFGRETISQFCDKMQPWTYVCAKPYYLSPRDQERIDTVDWYGEGPLAVRKISGFYDPEQHVHGHPDYTPLAIESTGKPGGKHASWESWVVGGHSRETWQKLGGMIETTQWGSVDLLYLQRRRILGIPNLTLTDDSTLCIHQHHDAPRDINKAHSEAGSTNVDSNSRYPTINNLW